MSDQAPDAPPSPLDRWFDRQTPGPGLRSWDDLLREATMQRGLYAQVQALTPGHDGQHLADIIAQSGEWGLIEVATPDEFTWAIGVRLPVRGGFLLLSSDGDTPSQMKDDQDSPDVASTYVWEELTEAGDLDRSAVFTLDPQRDQDRYGYPVSFRPLPSFPDARTLQARADAAPPTDTPRPLPLIGEVLAFFALPALLILCGAVMLGLSFVLARPLLLLFTGIGVSSGLLLFLSDRVRRPRQDTNSERDTADFWTTEEQGDLQRASGETPTSALPATSEAQTPLTDVRTLRTEVQADPVPEPSNRF